MSRFFFNVPAAGIVDREGTGLESVAAVLDEAIARSREIIAHAVSVDEEERQDWVLEATNEACRTILAMRLSDTMIGTKG